MSSLVLIMFLLACDDCLDIAMPSVPITAASLGPGSGRRTWEGNGARLAQGLAGGRLELLVEAEVLVDDRWLRGAARSARVHCDRSGIARTWRRVWTATPRHL